MILISSIIFFTYIILVCLKYGIPPSVSESYYLLPKKINILFTLALWGFALPIVFYADNGLLFFTGAGIVFVGAAAQFKDTFIRNIHFAGAIGAVLLSQTYIYTQGLWHVNIAFFVAAFLLQFVKNRVFWQEIAAFSAIIISLYILR